MKKRLLNKSIRKKALNKDSLKPYSLGIFILATVFLVSVTAFAQGGGGLTETIAIEGGKISGVLLGKTKMSGLLKVFPMPSPP